ncbi:MAG: hypothetical protein FWH12_07495 [Treponema sp.]|nr:hypothetical protein [Treponema sp.]
MKTSGKFIGLLSLLAFFAIALSSCSNPAGGGTNGGDPPPPPPPPYIITGSGTAYTATRSGAAIGTPDQGIQAVINAIREEANGADVTIQFGSGGDNVLDIGNNSAAFNNAGEEVWGHVTLTGSITSNESSLGSGGTVQVQSTVNLTSTGTITNHNAGGSAYGMALNHAGTGTVTISGGTVQTTEANYTNAIGINSSGLLRITGGLITSRSEPTINVGSSGRLEMSDGTIHQTAGQSATSSAIFNQSNNAEGVKISGGTVQSAIIAIRATGSGPIAISGNAIVTAATANTAQGTIVLAGTNARLTMSGGTVRNTNDAFGNRAINNTTSNHAEAIVITGGTVGAMNASSVHGGPITGTQGVAIRNAANGHISISGPNTRIVALVNNSGAGNTPGTIYLEAGSGNLTVSGGATVQNTGTIQANDAIFKHENHTGTVNVSGGNIVPAYEQ